jgi:mono/diheme cytochrome c family protein
VSRPLQALVLGVLLLSGLGCRRDMQDQPRLEPFEGSTFFDDGRAARPIPPHTIARGQLVTDELAATGKRAGKFVDVFPSAVTRETIARGEDRYNIYCTPCHDRTGSGRGLVVQRGFPRAASFHESRLREAPPGYLFNAITNGFGVMPSYAGQIPLADRWAIVAYVRVLQLSQGATLADVEPAKRLLLEAQAGATRE